MFIRLTLSIEPIVVLNYSILLGGSFLYVTALRDTRSAVENGVCVAMMIFIHVSLILQEIFTVLHAGDHFNWLPRFTNESETAIYQTVFSFHSTDLLDSF